MKRPTIASQKRVNAENLARLGAERLAELLVAAAAARPELKRRLRMELAAEQGAEHLALEIDKRLAALATSRSKVSWRQRNSFIRDLEALRRLIAERLAGLDEGEALSRLWLFMDGARRVSLRVRDRDGELAAVFRRAAGDLGAALAQTQTERAGAALADAMIGNPHGWIEWAPLVLEDAPPALADAALRRMAGGTELNSSLAPVIRLLADAAKNPDAYRATYGETAQRDPSVAGAIAQRLLAADRVEEAGRILQATAPGAQKARPRWAGGPVPAEPDPAWETAWIDYLERLGKVDDAQAARWAAFERTLAVEPARAYAARLTGFDDVEAEGRAFDYAARHPEFRRGLQFLMDWPALPEAAAMIQARPNDIQAPAELAELWAGRLRARYPAAAHRLLRAAAAAAFRRRELATCERLTQEADAIDL